MIRTRHHHFAVGNRINCTLILSLRQKIRRYAGKEKLLALGVYPEVSLRDARAAADEARRHLRSGVDPGELRKAQKNSRLDAAANSFQAVALE